MKLATWMLLFSQTLNQVADVVCDDAHGSNVTWRPTKLRTQCGGSASFALNLPLIFQLNYVKAKQKRGNVQFIDLRTVQHLKVSNGIQPVTFGLNLNASYESFDVVNIGPCDCCIHSTCFIIYCSICAHPILGLVSVGMHFIETILSM